MRASLPGWNAPSRGAWTRNWSLQRISGGMPPKWPRPLPTWSAVPAACAGGRSAAFVGKRADPTLVLAAAHLREEVLGDFRGVADLFPNGRLVVFPGVTGFVQHILPVPCARAWLDFAASLAP